MLLLVLFGSFSVALTAPSPMEIPSKAILGGFNATQGQFPFMVYGQYPMINGSVLQGGGSLLTDRHVLTAAHCVANVKFGKTFVVVLGVVDLLKSKEPGIQIKIIKKVHLPLSNPTGNYTYDDVAVLELASPVTFSPAVKPIRILRNDSQLLQTLDGGVIMGFGVTGYNKQGVGQTSSTLLWTEVPFTNHTICKKIYGFRVTDKSICVGANNKGSGAGDSGGPLAVMVDQEWTLLGASSFSTHTNDKEKKPCVYSRVSKFCDFIEDSTQNAFKCT